MTRQTVGILLAFGVVASFAAAFLAARSSRRQSLLAPLPSISLDQFHPSARLLVSASLERLKQDPLRADNWGELGCILAANEALIDAAACFTRAEELDPANFRWSHLSAHTKIGTDRAASIAALQRALKSQPNVVPSLGMLAEAYLEDGSDAEAAALLRGVVTERTNDARLLWLMARVEANAGANDKALQWAKRAAGVEPRRRRIRLLLSQLYHRVGDADSARKESRFLELLPPAEEEAPWRDGVVAALERYARRPDIVAAKARAMIAVGDGDGATRFLSELALEDRRRPEIQAAYALAKLQVQDFIGAEEALERVADQEDPNVVYARGMIAANRSEFEAAADRFHKVTKLRPGAEKVPALDDVHVARGICLLALGKSDEALGALEQALAINPGNYDALLKLSEMYLQKNRKADAARLLADAALLDPNDGRVKELQRQAAG